LTALRLIYQMFCTLLRWMVLRIMQTADHRTRHGPLRVLREVAAKRAVVQECPDGPQTQRDGIHVGRRDVAEPLMAALASVFAEHPDFNPE